MDSRLEMKALDVSSAQFVDPDITDDIFKIFDTAGTLAWYYPLLGPGLGAGIQIFEFIFGKIAGGPTPSPNPWVKLQANIQFFITRFKAQQDLSDLATKVKNYSDWRVDIEGVIKGLDKANYLKHLDEPAGYLFQINNLLGPQGGLYQAIHTVKEDKAFKNNSFASKEEYEDVKLKWQLLLTGMNVYIAYLQMKLNMEASKAEMTHTPFLSGSFSDLQIKVEEFKGVMQDLYSTVSVARKKMVSSVYHEPALYAGLGPKLILANHPNPAPEGLRHANFVGLFKRGDDTQEILPPYKWQNYARAGAKSVLHAEEKLNAGEYLVTENGRGFAIMQTDGNFCIYEGSGPDDNLGLKWGIPKGGNKPHDQYYAVLQKDGDFRVFNSKHESVWSSKDEEDYSGTVDSAKGETCYAYLTDSGCFGVYKGSGLPPVVPPRSGDSTDRTGGPPLWSVTVPRGFFDLDGVAHFPVGAVPRQPMDRVILHANESLNMGEFLVASSGSSFLIMQGDGNLCVYEGTGPDDYRKAYKWGTGGNLPYGKYRACMQSDGNLVVNSENGNVIWSSGTGGRVKAGENCFLTLIRCGNLELWKGTPENKIDQLWESRSRADVGNLRYIQDLSRVSSYTFIDKAVDNDDASAHMIVDDYAGNLNNGSETSRSAVCESLHTIYMAGLDSVIEKELKWPQAKAKWEEAVSFYANRVTPQTPAATMSVDKWGEAAKPDTLWCIPKVQVRYGISFDNGNDVKGESEITWTDWSNVNSKSNPTLKNIPGNDTGVIIYRMKLYRQFQQPKVGITQPQVIEFLTLGDDLTFPTTYTDKKEAPFVPWTTRLVSDGGLSYSLLPQAVDSKTQYNINCMLLDIPLPQAGTINALDMVITSESQGKCYLGIYDKEQVAGKEQFKLQHEIQLGVDYKKVHQLQTLVFPPIPVNRDQYVGLRAEGSLYLAWVDGPDQSMWWNIGTNASRRVSMSSCGWNVTITPAVLLAQPVAVANLYQNAATFYSKNVTPSHVSGEEKRPAPP